MRFRLNIDFSHLIRLLRSKSKTDLSNAAWDPLSEVDEKDRKLFDSDFRTCRSLSNKLHKVLNRKSSFRLINEEKVGKRVLQSAGFLLTFLPVEL